MTVKIILKVISWREARGFFFWRIQRNSQMENSLEPSSVISQDHLALILGIARYGQWPHCNKWQRKENHKVKWWCQGHFDVKTRSVGVAVCQRVFRDSKIICGQRMTGFLCHMKAEAYPWEQNTSLVRMIKYTMKHCSWRSKKAKSLEGIREIRQCRKSVVRWW